MKIDNTIGIKKNNRNKFFNYVYHSKNQLSKQDIANNINMSIPTVTQYLNEFLDENLMEFDGKIDSTGGRRANRISIRKDAKIAIGASFSANHIRLIAINFMAEQIAFKKIRLKHSTNSDLSDILAAEIEVFIKENKIDSSKILGVGITVPGIIDIVKEEVVKIPTFQYNVISINSYKDKINYKVYLENDANAAAFAEYWANKNRQNFVYLIVEEGVGGSLILDGKLFVGNNNKSCEFGHMKINYNGKLCECGQQGCFEAECSTKVLSSDLGITLEDFFQKIKEKDIESLVLWDKYLDFLSVGIANLQMIYDLDIIIGGHIVPYLDEYFETLNAKISRQNTFYNSAEAVQLSFHKHNSACTGAALHFISEYIETI
ncbi:MAG: ROK family transcriptional regulator [Lachnospiraceae bacterium]